MAVSAYFKGHEEPYFSKSFHHSLHLLLADFVHPRYGLIYNPYASSREEEEEGKQKEGAEGGE
jgi:hypothetical protein